MDVTTLNGKELDYMVRKSLNPDGGSILLPDGVWNPSSEWAQAGPIIEREHIEIYFSGIWKAAIKKRIKKTLPNGFQIETDWHKVCSGDTPLIAAMRCFVESKNK